MGDEVPTVERYVLSKQLLRAALSVALNIAESTARRTSADARRFVHVALGSLVEVVACLRIVEQRGVSAALPCGPLFGRSGARYIAGTAPSLLPGTLERSPVRKPLLALVPVLALLTTGCTPDTEVPVSSVEIPTSVDVGS